MPISVTWITEQDVRNLMSRGAMDLLTDDDATGDVDNSEGFVIEAINNVIATEVSPALIRWMSLATIASIDADSESASWLKGVTVPIVAEYLFARQGSEIPKDTKMLADNARRLLKFARHGKDDDGFSYTVPGLSYRLNDADDLMRLPIGVPRVSNPKYPR